MEISKSLYNLIYLRNYNPWKTSKEEMLEVMQVQGSASSLFYGNKYPVPTHEEINQAYQNGENLDASQRQYLIARGDSLSRIRQIEQAKIHGERNSKLFDEMHVGIGLYSIIRSMEYELIFAKEPASAGKKVSNEPVEAITSLNALEYFEYYYKKEKQRLIDIGYFSAPHMDDSYRFLLILDQFDQIDQLLERDPMIFIGAYRLFGYIAGRLTAIQMINCNKSEQEARNHAMSLLEKYMPIK